MTDRKRVKWMFSKTERQADKRMYNSFQFRVREPERETERETKRIENKKYDLIYRG